MRKKMIVGIFLTAIAIISPIPLNTFNNHIVHAEEEVGISTSLQDLTKEAFLTQILIDKNLSNPRIQVAEVPALSTNQSFIEDHMEKWSSDLYRDLHRIFSETRGFINKFDEYCLGLEDFVIDKEDEKGFLARITSMVKNVRGEKSTVQSSINALKALQLKLKVDLQQLSTSATEAKKVVGEAKTINETEITAIYKNIDRYLLGIATVSSRMNEAGTQIFQKVYDTVKPIADTSLNSAISAIEKAREIDKLIKEAEEAAIKKAREENKTEEEVEFARIGAGEEIRKKRGLEIAEAAIARAKEYDFVSAPQKIKETYGEFGKLGILTAEEQKNLNDLEKENQKLYDLTKKLHIVDLQRLAILSMENDMNTFETRIGKMITILEQYKKDWERIESVLNQLGGEKSYSKLSYLKRLCDQLRKGTRTFEKSVL